MEVEIEALDHFGLGVGRVLGKVIFVENALPGERVLVEIVKTKKNYQKGRVLEYLKKSDVRAEAVCPYFDTCGGCALMFYNYDKTLEFKKNKVQELIRKNKIDYDKDIEVIRNENYLNYRNKASLKIKDGKIGFYQNKTHQLVEINVCKIVNEEINKVIENYKLLGISNGSLTVRVNQNKEVLLIIESEEEKNNIELERLKECVKLVGIVYNGRVIYGQDFYYERIGGMLFKVSHDAFFQVNPFITEKLFQFVLENIDSEEVVLDLFSGVGTLGMFASKKVREVISVEAVKNAVLNGILNAKLNKRDNIKFMLGDVGEIVTKIKNEIDTLIVDPPRKGLDKNTKKYIRDKRPGKIIYISCDVSTLMRDLKELEDIYKIKDYKILDMFSFSYHLESFCVLSRR